MKSMTDEEARRFIRSVCRAEVSHEPYVYLKAVRVSLTALGYDHHWVEGPFRDMLEMYFQPDIEDYQQETGRHW